MKSALTENAEMMVGRFAYEDSLVANGYSDGIVRIYNINTDNKIS
jgi:2-methylaconitate cis-trans-isomerase PrpF